MSDTVDPQKRPLPGDELTDLARRMVEADDYMLSEYGLTPEEWSRAAKNLHAKAERAIEADRLQEELVNGFFGE